MSTEKIKVCPSLLTEGYSSYSPVALKRLFDGKPVSHILAFDSPAFYNKDGHNAIKEDSELETLNTALQDISTQLSVVRLRY